MDRRGFPGSGWYTFSTVMNFNYMEKDMALDPVIEPSGLNSLTPFHLLDVRDQTAFDPAHASNAVRVPIEEWEKAAKAEATSLENVSYWESELGRLGIDNETLAVIYDDGRMTEAARVWFILQYFGVKALILNGGWPAIAHLKIQACKPSGQYFHAQPDSGKVGLLNRGKLRSALDTDISIFDARTAAEYAGEDLRRNKRGGHLPGARFLPHAALLDNGRLRPRDELIRLLNIAGFRPGDHIVTHCDGGGRAALAAIAALRAGYTDVQAYYLSFSDWAKDDACPIVRE